MIKKEFISLICIDPVTDILNFGNGKTELTYGKEYNSVMIYYVGIDDVRDAKIDNILEIK